MDTGDVRVFKHMWNTRTSPVSMVTWPHIVMNRQNSHNFLSCVERQKPRFMQNDQYLSLHLDWNDILYNLFYQNGSFQKNSLLKSSLFDDFYYWRLRLFFTQIGDFSGYFWTSPGYISEKIIGNTVYFRKEVPLVSRTFGAEQWK